MTDTPKNAPDASNDTGPVQANTPAPAAQPAAGENTPEAKPDADKK
jgi:hypothetical protein